METKYGYEEIGPFQPGQEGVGKKRFLHRLLIGAVTICATALMVIFLLSTFTTSTANANGVPDQELSNGADADAELQAVAAEELNGKIDEDIIVELDKGKILGKKMSSRAGREYLAFLGIPYAKPPMGELRFQPPVEAEPWEGTLDGRNFKPDCIQKDKYNTVFTSKGSEDCLYLNVFTPKTMVNLTARRGTNRFPVMVYIHGGRQYGSATRYGAEYFMDEDVILVSFHYRLGVLGNLNTNDENARGNQGLKDQVMALQWVQDNIKEFGGNRRKVTLFGNSFGSIHTTSHMLSPMSKGLFHQAICESGTVFMPLLFDKNPLDKAMELAQKLNYTGNTTTADLVKFFRETPADKLVLTSYLMEFGTTVEPSADTDDVFMPDEPLKILRSGNFNKVSAIFGAQSGDGLMNSLPILNDPVKTEAFNQNWTAEAVLALQLSNSPTVKDPERIANAAREFYLRGKPLSRDTEANFTNMFTDRNFTHPANVFATSILNGQRSSTHNVFLYRFDVEAPKSYGAPDVAIYKPDHFLGAGHADELQFLFPYEPFPPVPLGSKFANFSQMMIRLWTTFAATGKPSGGEGVAEWEEIKKEKPYHWFDINTSAPKMIDTLGERMNFWDTFNLTDLYY